MAFPSLKHTSPQIYLEEERMSKTKHQYFDGKIIATAGASLAHNTIVANLLREVGGFLKGKSCRIFPNDLRVSIPSALTYTYPDATIICGEPEVTDDISDTIKNPSVIFEVLSGSTREYDSGNKFLYYQRIASLKEYILIDSLRPSVSVYQQQENGLWKIETIENAASLVSISTIDYFFSFSDLYADVIFKEKDFMQL